MTEPDNVKFCADCGCKTWHRGTDCEWLDMHTDDQGVYKRLSQAEAALRSILEMHDGNQPAALNMPDLEYARRTIRSIHAEARAYFEQGAKK